MVVYRPVILKLTLLHECFRHSAGWEAESFVYLSKYPTEPSDRGAGSHPRKKSCQYRGSSNHGTSSTDRHDVRSHVNCQETTETCANFHFVGDIFISQIRYLAGRLAKTRSHHHIRRVLHSLSECSSYCDTRSYLNDFRRFVWHNHPLVKKLDNKNLVTSIKVCGWDYCQSMPASQVVFCD